MQGLLNTLEIQFWSVDLDQTTEDYMPGNIKLLKLNS